MIAIIKLIIIMKKNSSKRVSKNCVYGKEYLLSFRRRFNKPPKDLRPIIIRNNTRNNNNNRRHQQNHRYRDNKYNNSKHSHSNSHSNRKWDDLNDIRSFTSSKDSFTRRTQQLSVREKFIGTIRGLLNKITTKTFDNIKETINSIIIPSEESEQTTIEQDIAKIFAQKVSHDKVYGALYGQMCIVLCEKIKGLKPLISTEVISFITNVIDEKTIIEDIKKTRLLNVLSWLSWGIYYDIIEYDVINEKIITPIVAKIKKLQKLESESYSSIVSNGGIGLWTEFICTILESYLKNESLSNKRIQHIIELLTILKDDRKKVKARIRFMIEDLLTLIK